MRTLCIVCHARVTKEQCAERRSTRLRAKKQKELMNDLRNVQNLKQNYSEEKDSKQMIIQDDAVEEDLLIEVPGTAYCNVRNISTGSEENEKKFISKESGHLDSAFTVATNISTGGEKNKKKSLPPNLDTLMVHLH